MTSVNEAMARHGETLDKTDDLAKMLCKASSDLAEMRREYSTLLAATIVAEREAGTPVTLVKDMAKGNGEVAKMAMEIEMQEAIVGKFKADLMTQRERSQATYNLWKQAKDYEERDWRQAGMGAYGA